MTGLVKIDVTRDHINRGICNEPGECAIGLALTEHFGVECGASTQIRIGPYPNITNLYFGRDIAEFISDFDDTEWDVDLLNDLQDIEEARAHIKPFTLVLDFDKNTAYAERSN
jgi:hypothetical protein